MYMVALNITVLHTRSINLILGLPDIYMFASIVSMSKAIHV